MTRLFSSQTLPSPPVKAASNGGLTGLKGTFSAAERSSGGKLPEECLAVRHGDGEHPVGELLALLELAVRRDPVHPIGIDARHPDTAVRQHAPAVFAAEDPAFEPAAGVAIDLGQVERGEPQDGVAPRKIEREAHDHRGVALAAPVGAGRRIELDVPVALAVAGAGQGALGDVRGSHRRGILPSRVQTVQPAERPVADVEAVAHGEQGERSLEWLLHPLAQVGQRAVGEVEDDDPLVGRREDGPPVAAEPGAGGGLEEGGLDGVGRGAEGDVGRGRLAAAASNGQEQRAEGGEPEGGGIRMPGI